MTNEILQYALMTAADSAIEKFRTNRVNYESLTSRLVSLISELLKLKHIKFQTVEGRTKSLDSFADKVRRPNKSYTDPFSEITDLSGVRVILFYNSDVSRVEKLIEGEFRVLEKVISHTPGEYDYDQFGYVSWHYIVTLNESRCTLPEWSSCHDLKSEIQVRTVLQHSWASVSHALLYKREDDVPSQLKRRLSRLAGLFEIADDEFDAIRDQQETAEKHVIAALKSGDEEVVIDVISIKAFLNEWHELPQLKAFLTSQGYHVDKKKPKRDIANDIAAACKKLGILTINNLKHSIKGDYKTFFKSIIQGETSAWYVSRDFVLYLLLIKSFPDKFSVKELVNNGWGSEVAKHVINSARKLKHSTES